MPVNSYKMMMLSGVLRPAFMEIRRHPDVVPLASSTYLPEFLTNFFDLSFGTVSKPRQMARWRDKKPLSVNDRFANRGVSARFSLRSFLVRFGMLCPTSRRLRQELPPHEQAIQKLEKKVQALEALLEAERSRSHAQRHEIEQLQSQLTLVDELQAELTIERESGKLLVHWLQEAEQQLADLRERPARPAR